MAPMTLGRGAPPGIMLCYTAKGRSSRGAYLITKALKSQEFSLAGSGGRSQRLET